MPGPPIDEIDTEQAKRAFHEHLVDKAMAARLKYGLYIDAAAILQMLKDPEVVRYPTTVLFDASPLQPHEFAYSQPLGFHASDGYALCIHPFFKPQREILPLLIAYHIPTINYGGIVEADDAELYGTTLLGLEADTYYQALCELTDAMIAARGTH
ncbi:MAG: hypothetical protein ACYSXF_00540 [Planctomycetota bacterium]|jgi:hypothetical protein